jgi:hypothetical protein
MSDIVVQDVNCDDFCNALGYLIAIQAMDSNTQAKMHRISAMLSYMHSIISIKGSLDVPLNKSGVTYRQLFDNHRNRWKKLLTVYSNNTDEWKDSLGEIESIFQSICEIALREGLAKNIYREIHNIKYDQTCEFDNTPIEGDL